MNLRPQDYMNLRPQTKIVNPRLQKSCEPKANHAACSPNASGGEALRPPPQPPSSCFFFFLGLPPLQGQPTPTWNVSTSNWNHRKKNNSQNKKLIPKIFPHPFSDGLAKNHQIGWSRYGNRGCQPEWKDVWLGKGCIVLKFWRNDIPSCNLLKKILKYRMYELGMGLEPLEKWCEINGSLGWTK